LKDRKEKKRKKGHTTRAFFIFSKERNDAAKVAAAARDNFSRRRMRGEGEKDTVERGKTDSEEE